MGIFIRELVKYKLKDDIAFSAEKEFESDFKEAELKSKTAIIVTLRFIDPNTNEVVAL